MAAFRGLPQVTDVVGSGDTKTSVVLGNGLQVDLRVVEPQNWGAAVQYFTGNKEHNVALREIAIKQGWSLNEYGLTATGDGSAPDGEMRYFEDEPDLYAFLGLAWMPPEMRENRGEIQAARERKLPQLIVIDDLRGELHGHTTWSDGTASVMEMAEAARRRGYSYWGVTDHSVGLGVVQGVDGERLRRQREEIDAANEHFGGQGIDFRLLQGSEVEILADGTLGLPDEVLKTLDVAVASIHSAQRQDRETITARCLKAVYNPYVDILGHPDEPAAGLAAADRAGRGAGAPGVRRDRHRRGDQCQPGAAGPERRLCAAGGGTGLQDRHQLRRARRRRDGHYGIWHCRGAACLADGGGRDQHAAAGGDVTNA